MASIAVCRGNTFGVAGLPRRSHLRKAQRQLSGTPPMETKLLGINGRSCTDADKMPYSCAKTTADAKSAGR